MPVDGLDRREFLTLMGLAGAGACVGVADITTDATTDLWAEADAILRRIKPPTFPNRTFDLTKFNPTDADATLGFQRAVAACHAAGGGRVVVPPGRWVTGPIVLRSNVELHLENEATIAFTQD